MSLEKLIKESMDRDPLSLKESIQEELKNRIALALEAKMNKESDYDDDDDDDDDDETLDEISKEKAGRYHDKAVESGEKMEADFKKDAVIAYKAFDAGKSAETEYYKVTSSSIGPNAAGKALIAKMSKRSGGIATASNISRGIKVSSRAERMKHIADMKKAGLL
jgi:hypothetical protein